MMNSGSMDNSETTLSLIGGGLNSIGACVFIIGLSLCRMPNGHRADPSASAYLCAAGWLVTAGWLLQYTHRCGYRPHGRHVHGLKTRLLRFAEKVAERTFFALLMLVSILLIAVPIGLVVLFGIAAAPMFHG